MKIERFEDIIAWQLGRELTSKVYRLLEDSRNFGFRDQMQRASLSIMNNIAEGFGRVGNKEFSRYLKISKGSCLETRSMLYVALDNGVIADEATFKDLFDLTVRIEQLLVNFIKSLDNK